MTTSTKRWSYMPLVVLAGCLVADVVITAPQRPALTDRWRLATIAVGLAASAWNFARAGAAFRRSGPVSVVGFLHLWVFLTFSFPAVEMTFRYDRLSLGLWQVSTDKPLLLQVALLLAGFQVLFFFTLGEGVDASVARLIRSSQTQRPDQRVGLVFVALLLPLVLARLLVLRGLGASGIATSMVTRTDYFSQLNSGVNPVIWALNTAFPVYAVGFACLAVKFLVPHPSPLGRRLFIGVLVGCIGGVALSGGRAELVFVTITVGLFVYAAGYRTLRHFAPLVVPVALVAGLVFAVGQARHGEDNVLSQAAAGVVVGNDYSRGDITQALGLGRFDAVVMIFDRHAGADDLHGSSYIGALSGGVQATFLPRIAADLTLPSPSVSGEVLGRWVFGGPKVSVLPSAPGEAYLNFGMVGVFGAALALGLLARALVGFAGRLPGPHELLLVLFTWTVARLLSDESALIATFVVRNWPVIVVVMLVVQEAASTRTRAFPATLARR